MCFMDHGYEKKTLGYGRRLRMITNYGWMGLGITGCAWREDCGYSESG